MAYSRTLIAGRYAFLGLLKNTQKAERWVGIDQDTGRRVVLLVSDPSRLTSLALAKGVKHRHLAGVIEVVRELEAGSIPSGAPLPTGFGLVVAEFVAGKTLRTELSRGGLNPAKAVAWTLRMADAVQLLHGAGAVHGAVSPRSVIALPEGRAIAPVLSQLVAPVIGCYCAPERLRGAAETPTDDVWALHATLYAALTGQSPYAAVSRDALLKQMLAGRPEPLSSFGIDEPTLQEILDRGLSYEKRVRVFELSEFIGTLDAWERAPFALPPKRQVPPRPASRSLAEIVSGSGLGRERDDGIVIDDRDLPDDEGAELVPRAPSATSGLGAPPSAPSSSGFAAALSSSAFAAPPSSPASAAESRAPSGSVAPEARGSSPHHTLDSRRPPAGLAASPAESSRISSNPFERKRPVWPLVVIAALAGGGGVYLAVLPDADAPNSNALTSSVPVLTAKLPAPERKKLSPREELTACVASYFDPGTLTVEEDVTFVCDEGDLRVIASRLYASARALPPVSADAGSSRALEPVERHGLGLDWYELPATAVIRNGCCTNPTAVTLPETEGWCEQLQVVVRRIAEDSTKAGDLAPDARSFDKAVACLFANRVTRSYPYERAPSAGNRAAFQQFLSRAAISEARR